MTTSRTAFTPPTQADELKSPDLEINVLMKMQNVTARLDAAVKPGMSDAEALKARQGMTAAISKEAKDASGLEPEIVSFYQGGQTWL